MRIFNRYEHLFVISFFSLMIGVFAYANSHYNAEIQSCGAWTLHTVYGGLGCTIGLDGVAFHVEGATNLNNLSYLAGNGQPFSLTYEIATNRLLFPYFGSLLVPMFGSILVTVKTLNSIWWLIGSVSAYYFAKCLTVDRRIAWFAGLFVVSGIGFAATWMGVKAHLLSYSYFVLALYVLERIGLFDDVLESRKLIAAGAMIGLGAFANGLVLPLVIYVAIRFVVRLRIKQLFQLAFISILPLLSVKLGFSLFGASSGDRTDTVILTNFLNHFKMIFQFLFNNESAPIFITNIKITSPWEPFGWIYHNFLVNLPFLFGTLGLILAVIGLMPPWSRVQKAAIIIISCVCIAVVGVQTYWPFWGFRGYTVYYVYVGFSLLIGLGICRLTDLIGSTILIWVEAYSSQIRVGTFVCLTVIWVSYSSHHIVTHRYLHFLQYYYSQNVGNPEMRFPDDWDFRVANW